MSILGRVMTTLSTARTAWVSYNQKDLLARAGWDSYNARLSRYAIYEAYYDNTAYDAIETFSAKLKTDERLYKHIRGLYNPVKRENELYVANTYQGNIDAKALTEGALPLQFDNAAFEQALPNVLRWSNLGQQLDRYVQYAALYGDAFWWIVDDPQRERVRMELLHPSRVRDIQRDEVGNIRAAVIEYEREEDPQLEQYQPSRLGSLFEKPPKVYLYTMKVTKVADTRRDPDAYGDGDVLFETFKDGEPFAYYYTAEGLPLTKWYADYGFVPMKAAHFQPTADGWGKNSFYATRRKIDELNDQASIVDDTIRRVIEPLLKAKGVRGASDLNVSKEDRDALTIIYLSNAEGDIEALQIPVDLGSAAKNAESLLAEIERDMPLLALQRIRENGSLTAPGVRTGYSDAIAKVNSLRGNLDPALVGALQMACTIGAVRGYDGFGGFNINSYDNGDMELAISDRGVIHDSLSRTDKLALLTQLKDQPKAVARQMLKEGDYSPSVIKEILDEMDSEAQSTLQQPANGAGTGNSALPADIETILAGIDGNAERTDVAV